MAELFSDIFDITISQGTFVNIINECSEKIKPCVEKIREELKNTSVFRYEQYLHGLCNTHHLRELTFFEEKGEKWAKKIKQCLSDAYKEKKEKIFVGEKQINKE